MAPIKQIRNTKATGYRTITQSELDIKLISDKSGICQSLSVTINKLPPSLNENDEIFVQLQTKKTERQEKMGKVKSPKPLLNLKITDFESAPKLRVFVRAPDDPLITARSKWISTKKYDKSEDKSEEILGILPMEADDNLGDVLWKLRFDDDGPVIMYNPDSNLNVKGMITVDPVISAFVIPEILRQILRQLQEKEKNNADAWLKDWKDWVKSQDDDGLPDHEDKMEDWEDSFVSQFSRKNQLIKKMNEEY